MKKRARKPKATRVEHPSEALQKAEIKTLKRVRAQRAEISRLLRQIHKLGVSVTGELVDFSIGALERTGRYRVELISDRESGS